MDHKYEEALERARKGMPIDEIFPELKESEDERIRKSLLAYIKGESNRLDTKKWIVYLEKRKEQKPAEWSKEDEKYLNLAINIVTSDFGEDSPTVSWLKSIRPQPHWKPSTEQMEALMWQVKNTSENSWQRRASEDLYNDLKKLI